MSTQSDKGLLVNIDINTVVYPFLNEVVKKSAVSETDLYPFIDQYAHTQVTDIALDVFCQYSNTPSAVFTDAVHKYLQQEENRLPVDYRAYYHSLYQIEQQYGLDLYGIWFRRCRELGLTSWLSVRMNDAHCPDEETCFLRSDFFYTARKNGWTLGSSFGYYRNCLNYAVPEVRRMMLQYIGEQLQHYDVDGLELDFLREIYCFDMKRQSDVVALMNDFMRQVRGIVMQAERQWGHPIRLMCRMMRDIRQNLAFGFDIAAWLREKLVDIIAVGPRWATCDSDMPIAAWKELCGAVPVYACLEALVCRPSNESFATAGVARGYAAQYLSQGADKIYLYNYFQNPYQPSGTFSEIYRTCGSLQTAMANSRRHIVTSQDLCPEGFTPYRPLPATLQPSAEVSLAVKTGPVPDGKSIKVIVGFGQESADTAISVELNGAECQPEGPTRIESYHWSADRLVDNGYVGQNAHLLAYVAPAAISADTRIVRIRNNSGQLLTVAYLELALC